MTQVVSPFICLAWCVCMRRVCDVCMAVAHFVLMVLVGSEAGSERQRENLSGGGFGLAEAVVHSSNSGR